VKSRLLRAGLASLAIVVALSAAAVTRANGPATGSAGPAAGGGTSAAPTNAPKDDLKRDLDLPVEKPVKREAVPPPPAPIAPEPGPPTNGDDTPPTFYGTQIRSENQTIIYVIDISNSMSSNIAQYVDATGFLTSGSRLDRAKAELLKSIQMLPPSFRFNVFSYNCAVKQWQPQTVPADTDNKNGACVWVMSMTTDDQLPSGEQTHLGGTATGPAVALALQDKSNKLVMLLTDGRPNCGAGPDPVWNFVPGPPPHWEGPINQADINNGHRVMIRDANTQGAIINVFGIAADEPLMRQFCMDVATDAHGSYTDVR
jgi:hypothetical protein